MQVKCDYCDHYIDDTDAMCPHCGAPNDRMMRSGDGVPKTIEELKEFCQAHNLPLKQMRFFIGEDYQQPRAFGLYQNGEGDFIVYKNKADGSRIIRYRGEDEAYAVNEIYQKMRTEIQERRGQGQVGNKRVLPSSSGGGGGQKSDGRGLGEKLFNGRRPGCLRGCLIAIIIFAVLAFIGAFLPDERDTAADHGSSSYGYYEDDDNYYYDDDDYDSGWSNWDDDDDGWSSWDDDDGWSSDWDDDDWDWDSGDSWDSGSSDWDSDW